MTLSDLANIGTFASAIAVLVSLIYLSTQIRQAKKNQRAQIDQGVATRTTEIVRWAAEPHIAQLRTRVLTGETEFSAQEIVQLSFILRVTIIAIQDSHRQHNVGLADQATLENALGGSRALLAQPVFRAIWSRIRRDFSAETTRYIEQMIAETPLTGPIDIVARFKSDLTALRG